MPPSLQESSRARRLEKTFCNLIHPLVSFPACGRESERQAPSGSAGYQDLQGRSMAAPAPHNSLFVILFRVVVWLMLLMLLITRGVSAGVGQ